MKYARAGQPTKYKPEFCEQLVKHMAEGLSFESFAAVPFVCVDTLHEWANRHPKFSDARKRGRQMGLKFWEEIGRAGCVGKIKNFNVVAWIFNMKNRYHWRDTKEIEQSEFPRVQIIKAGDSTYKITTGGGHGGEAHNSARKKASAET